LLTTSVASASLDVLGDDEQRLAGLDDRFQHRQHRLQVESFFVEEDHRSRAR
jgi:hypothetical protein